MTFSIVTPVLNGMPHIRQCVGSVRRQADVCWEHIVRDGGSQDGTVEWLQGQEQLICQAGRDKGMYHAIGLGWQQATGDILSWLNADEQYLPLTLSSVANEFERCREVDVIFGDYITCDAESGKPMAARKEIPLRRSYVINGPLYAMSCATFFRRRLLDKGLLQFDCSLRTAADFDLIVRLLDSGTTFSHVSRYLALYGVTGRNMSTSAEAARESLLLRNKYGAARSECGRIMIRSLRCLEKLSRNCYGRHKVSYSFMKDERHDVDIEAEVGSSWR